MGFTLRHLRGVTSLLVLGALFANGRLCADETPQGKDRPNIIYIMSDDMGYSDIGCYGSEIETPTLDALAAKGVRFTQFYNMARCCPTRACLLTGLYPHQAGVGHMMSDSGYDGYRGELNRSCVTLAEVLRTAGYKTYMSGKWHVTKHVNPKSEIEKNNWPLQRGFDRFYGTIHGAGSFYDPNSLTRDNQLISPANDPEYQPANGFYYTDAIADHAVRFVQEHHASDGDNPFFMYVSFTAAHWPMHAREPEIAKYAGAYDEGYEAIRAKRYQKMLDLGVISADSTVNWPLEEAWKETEHLGWDIRNMEVYAAMIDSMDRGIGRLVKTLEEQGELDNTLILFFQDNGGCAEGYGRGKDAQARADRPTLEPLGDDHLQTNMQPKQTRDGYPVRTGKGVMAGPADTYIGYGKAWATVSNTPFREYKHWVHEGGISTPLIAHWPDRIRRHGELEHSVGHVVDLMATAVDVAGATYPKEFHDGHKITPTEGVSLLPAFEGRHSSRGPVYWEHEGNRAIRDGDLKLVAKGAGGAWELYNISEDRSEQHDLADKMPGEVARLSELWNAYAERAAVLPLTPYRKSKEKLNASKLRFSLEPGAALSRAEGPMVAKRGLTVTVDIQQAGTGVLVAQGGVTHGWALFVDEQKRLTFAMTNGGERTQVSSSEPISDTGKAKLVWGKDRLGKLIWRANEVASFETKSLVVEQPADGLEVGRDEKGNVGSYQSPNTFTGKIAKVVIKLEK